MLRKSVDYKLFFASVALIAFGMIMISSVSVWGSFRVTSSMEQKGLIEAAYNHFYVLRNIIHVVLGLVTIGIFVKIPFQYYEKSAKYIFSLSIILLIVVLILGESYGGASGWISIPGVPFNLQPTEFLKFAIIIFLAAFMKQYQRYIPQFKEGFLPFLGIVCLVIILVGAQPDFGTILVVVPLSFIMFFVAGANIKHLGVMFLLGVFLATAIYTSGKYDENNVETRNKLSYITDRIDNFLADNKEAIDNKTINYQTEQALIAIGSGGFAGLGFGNSIQKYGYLPEVQGDFIFSVIAEELGFLGVSALMTLFGFIAYRGLRIARYSKDLFAKYAATGITTWIVLQACINIGVNLNIVPLTGITLPFVSYGGSSLLALSLGLALLLSISRDIDPESYKKLKKRKKQFSLRKQLGI